MSSGAPTISKVARTFFQCLSAIQYPLDAILILVTEFKLAFGRALALPESQLKHIRIRTLASLLSQIFDAQNNTLQSSRVPINPSHFSRLLIRRGFISDLARATHSLSLNSPHLVGTINNILKPLEVLTRIVNQVASSLHRTSTAATIATTGPQTRTTTTTSATQTASVSSSVIVATTTGSSSMTTATAQSPASNQTTQTQHGNEHTRNPGDGTVTIATSTPTTITNREECTTDTSFLEATHESLIPLEEEEEEDNTVREEILTLAHELGRQHREELTVAGSGDMDIQVMYGNTNQRKGTYNSD